MKPQDLYDAWRSNARAGRNEVAAEYAEKLARALTEDGAVEPRWSAADRLAFLIWDPTGSMSDSMRDETIASERRRAHLLGVDL